ncbi:DUF3604 domain-containing protein [Fulvivirga sedimenti]|uniref:DUF3604 domain-containing protein n=1 Tax=Fulvivirga sedimenti TaxID=2879465 RepID=A0A9X1HPT4_9BACT|nr:DUF3604 domain-containing protein [Fulvivirga sedimenti]MCA6074965.1 DUF3604 domain-containing protein [Fulvivirga sedimenti]MCA6076142.1 DUF3604 domain-containing protein [Fulvivirga sedimenti]MCA6077270.1 DUF3604 domain-containing protein [Fulvivirga sedimenti]
MTFKFLPGLLAIIVFTSCETSTKQNNTEQNTATSPLPEVVNNPDKDVYFGDTHYHTTLSGDAFGGGTRITAEQALRMAMGEPMKTSTGQDFQIRRPYDFLVITDHAEGFGVFDEIAAGNDILMADSTAKRWFNLLQGGEEEAKQLAVEIPYALANNKLPEPVTNPETAIPILRSAWQNFTSLIDRYNQPGKFTTIIGYEWTSVPTGNNLHRNIFFRDDKEKVNQILPFSALQSEDPEKLWEFLSSYEEKTGGRVFAIPHNGNISGGLMFNTLDASGNPITAEYAQKRQKWEPMYEITQIKGTGETHPMLSPTDEFANFGIAGWDNGNLTLDILETPEQRKYQYARKALIDGLQLEKELGINPYKFGFVGATDTHTGIPSVDDDNWWGKHVSSEKSPKRLMENVKELNGATRYGYGYLAGGHTAVWAESNTRESIWDGLASKEAYGTTGTRIKLRVFAGYQFTESDMNRDNYIRYAYDNGLPMGGDLQASQIAPKFLIHAMKDPEWANLDRIQVIKGWVKDGKSYEKIYNVAWSGDRQTDAGGNIPPVGNTVRIEDATYTNEIGAAELKTIWEDPDFDPSVPAFYYVRVLEIPSPTWQLYDIVKYGLTEFPEDVPLVQQERAWSSPIWYDPR